MRHQFHHRIQFLDGVFRLSETSSNDVTRVITETDIREVRGPDGQTVFEALEQIEMPAETRMLLGVMLSNPDALLQYGCDVTAVGWFNMPDPPDDAVEPGDPDPSGGIPAGLRKRPTVDAGPLREPSAAPVG